MRALSSVRRFSGTFKALAAVDRSFSSPVLFNASSSSGTPSGKCQNQNHCLLMPRHPYFSKMIAARHDYSTEAATVAGSPSDAVKEIHDKMLESINVKRTSPPNAWLWSLIENCKSQDDIKLLFDVLENLRKFRLSNLRIHDNFNCNLCREITRACTRVGAIDYGMKALWKHNVYGLTPNAASANFLLNYAKDHKDDKLMVEVMKLLKKNGLPLQPGTADIVLRICHEIDNWDLISKYSRRFVKEGVKLRQTSFDTWMEFAAKRGDTEELWKIEKLRSEMMKKHSLSSGFSCAKGLLLERKPQEAVAIIQVLDQTLPDAAKSRMGDELQKLVTDWPLDVIRHQEDDNRKKLAAALKADIPAMIAGLLDAGLVVSVNLESLKMKEEAL